MIELPSKKITADIVKAFRDKTGAGLLETKEVLSRANGDLLLAEGLLRYKGLAINPRGRTNAEWEMDQARAWVEEQNTAQLFEPVGDDYEEPKYDFKLPEDVIFQVVSDDREINRGSWKGYALEIVNVITDHGPEKAGAATYDMIYGSLDYTIIDMYECPGLGWFVVTGTTAEFYPGDRWETDDDMAFFHTGVRPATQEEIDFNSEENNETEIEPSPTPGTL